MNGNATFAAPWSNVLRTITVLSVFVLVGVAAIGYFSLPHHLLIARVAVMISPLVLLVATIPFMVRGYEIRGHELLVKRLGWCTRFDLGTLESAVNDPAAFSGAIRVAGNGGMFAFCGMFRSKKLGPFRALATDPKRSVVLRFPGKVVVVTPDEPERFVADVTKEK